MSRPPEPGLISVFSCLVTHWHQWHDVSRSIMTEPFFALQKDPIVKMGNEKNLSIFQISAQSLDDGGLLLWDPTLSMKDLHRSQRSPRAPSNCNLLARANEAVDTHFSRCKPLKEQTLNYNALIPKQAGCNCHKSVRPRQMQSSAETGRPPNWHKLRNRFTFILYCQCDQIEHRRLKSILELMSKSTNFQSR